MINLDMVGRLRPVKEGMWPEVLGCLSVPEVRGLPGMLPLSVVLQDIQKDWYSPKEKLIVQGTATAKNFDVLLAQLNRKFDFGFANALSFKDVRLCLDEAEALGVPMVVGAAVRQMLSITHQIHGAAADCTENGECGAFGELVLAFEVPVEEDGAVRRIGRDQ